MSFLPRLSWRSPWLFVAAVVAYVGLIGPWLMSADDTLSVIGGIALLVALAAWAVWLGGLFNTRKEP